MIKKRKILPNQILTGTRYIKKYKRPRAQWTKSENEKLLELVNIKGEKWNLISKEFDYKFSSLQCENHWILSINPAIKKGRWSDEETKKLLEFAKINGAKKWIETASLIKTRTAMQCRQHYFSIIKYEKSLNIENKNNIKSNKENSDKKTESDNTENFLFFIEKTNI